MNDYEELEQTEEHPPMNDHADEGGIQFDEEDSLPQTNHVFDVSEEKATSEELVMQSEDDYLLSSDLVMNDYHSKASSDDTISDETNGTSSIPIQDLLSFKYIVKSEKVVKRKKQIKGTVRKILWKQMHEPYLPHRIQDYEHQQTNNHTEFIYLDMREAALADDIIRVTQQFGSILMGLDITDCNLSKAEKKEPAKKKRKKEEENTEEQKPIHPVLKSIADNCNNLEVLKLEGNSFTAQDMVQSQLFKKCLRLKTYYGPLDSTCLENNELRRLRKLRIETEKLTNMQIRSIIKNCQRLRIIKTKNETSMTYKILEDWGDGCEGITKLFMNNIKFSGAKDKLGEILEDSYRDLTTLVMLNENTITSADLKLVGNISGLRHLNLTRCDQLTDDSLTSIFTHCKNLSKVILDNCWQVTDASFIQLKNLPELSYLDISSIRVTNKTLKIITDNIVSGETFTHFVCESNYNVTDDGLKVFLEKCPHLQCLNINRWEKLTDVSLENIGTYLKDIKQLGIVQGSKMKARISSDGLRKALQSKKMEWLAIHAIDKISDAMAALSELCPQLKHFSIRGNENVSDEALEVMCEGCKLLECLDISQCCKLTDEALNAVSNCLRYLREINICDCEEMTCDGIEVMLDACNYLSRVHINKTDFPYIEQAKALFYEHSIRYLKPVDVVIK